MVDRNFLIGKCSFEAGCPFQTGSFQACFTVAKIDTWPLNNLETLVLSQKTFRTGLMLGQCCIILAPNVWWVNLGYLGWNYPCLLPIPQYVSMVKLGMYVIGSNSGGMNGIWHQEMFSSFLQPVIHTYFAVGIIDFDRKGNAFWVICPRKKQVN